MKVGEKNIRDRRGAAQRILDQVRQNGCLPRYANWRTVEKLKKAGEIHFSGGRYWHVSQVPKPIRLDGYYWVKTDGRWEVAEWCANNWYCINGQRPFADDTFDIIGEKIEPSPSLLQLTAALEKVGA